eukprot:TRINITY_DN48883_c0_g1_i1.p1 TRINITY_DN48883_c0_g1~~TRINITY_DN48883_c0_g1_i1.p1  ORF type:complete len:439 (+),score=53.97 TRINITY_DN48883_c0_g1_i1:75-1319(+)
MVLADSAHGGAFTSGVVATIETQQYACCCAWAPKSLEPGLLAYGTYECVENASARRGGLCLAKPGQASTVCGTVELPGVYDIAWTPAATNPTAGTGEGGSLCAAVLGSGEFVAFMTPPVLLGAWQGEVDGTTCHDEASSKAGAPVATSTVATSLGSPVLRQEVTPDVILTHVVASSSTSFACSGQDGYVHRLLAREGAAGLATSSWAAHDAEAWFVEEVPWETSLLLSGGDDCSLALWDCRADPSSGAAARNKRTHEAGVLAAAFAPRGSFGHGHAFVTGCYDERVRIWDLRNIVSPVSTGPRCGDGTYRLCWYPSVSAKSEDDIETSSVAGLLVVAAMRAGILLCNASTLEVLHCHEHGRGSDDAQEGIAYGLSVCGGGVDFGGRDHLLAAASTSFYDRTVQVWAVDGPGSVS